MDDYDMGEFAYDYVGLDPEHIESGHRGEAVDNKRGVTAQDHELGAGVGGREGPHHLDAVPNEKASLSAEHVGGSSRTEV